MNISSVKGFRDVLPADAALRRALIEAARHVLESYAYREVELPVLERGELFERSVGATTDIVEKEMYAFEDRDGTLVALRPEGTASLVRCYVSAGMPRSLPMAKLFYAGPMFRRERPQKGRLRQFTQIGAEFLGRDDAEADAETICLVSDLCRATGLEDARIEINSLGDADCRPRYREALAAFARERRESLCRDCQERLERNPLRLLDCKNPSCNELLRNAPVMMEHLCKACREHHDRVVELLDAQGLSVTTNHRMVRGLDYYCRTAFEVIAGGLGAQNAVGGGGRYDGLVGQLGGPEVPGIGFAFGLERMELASRLRASTATANVLVAPVGEQAAGVALRVARRLRHGGRCVELGSSGRRLKLHLKHANRDGVRYVVIIGEDELAAGSATVRDLEANQDRPACFPLDASVAEMVAGLERTNQ